MYLQIILPPIILPIKIFINEDEAGIKGPSIDYRFECPDYESPNEISKSFIEKVLELTIKDTEKN